MMSEPLPTRKPAESGGDDARQLQEFVRELAANQGRMRAFIVSLMPGDPAGGMCGGRSRIGWCWSGLSVLSDSRAAKRYGIVGGFSEG